MDLHNFTFVLPFALVVSTASVLARDHIYLGLAFSGEVRENRILHHLPGFERRAFNATPLVAFAFCGWAGYSVVDLLNTTFGGDPSLVVLRGFLICIPMGAFVCFWLERQCRRPVLNVMRDRAISAEQLLLEHIGG